MNRLFLILLLIAAVPSNVCAESDRLEFNARARVRSAANSNEFQIMEKPVQWNPKKTAIVVCDMWDKHWCRGASARVAEMAPTMNRVLKSARHQGVFIIHAPSDTMKYYEKFPQRDRARKAPKAPLSQPLKRWTSLTPEKEGILPIDDSDGGCDCQPPCKNYTAWTNQIDALDIEEADAITDDGNEVYALMQARGIDNLIVMGVHINMCVLGRSFSIRQMVNLGKQVVLMRDLTDSMYNSRMRPFVSHFRGTDLVIEHIEKFWCASLTSTAFTHEPSFHFRADRPLETTASVAGNEEVAATINVFQPKGEIKVPGAVPATPDETIRRFKIAAGYTVEVVASEPAVRQPVSMNFDERGRLWVVQYLQYPFPAGLKVVKYDEYLRAVFDRVPAAPPNHVRGADRITIFEDKDGDGVFESHKDFLDGLNIATSALPGRGGVYVLNPPYLLFYPDRNRDDVPDGDPEVLLSGFGLEDTHAVANSLTWGPDGWIYGAQGSTCTANVQGVRFLGQAIWRFHPTTRKFELFAEGGGNTFGIEIDSGGRIFSGHNGDGTRGFHFVQGGYYQKTWGKHGPLTNPHAYGFFPFMKHAGEKPRFSHSFVIYEGGSLALPGEMISILPLHNRVQGSAVEPDGSTLRTVDRQHLVDSDDRWFRPVDIKVGPDGAVYLADWYDIRLTHLDPRDNWDKSNGRIYRFRSARTPVLKAFDLSRQTSLELVSLLSHSNKWFRQQALRVLGDRRDASIIPALRELLARESGQTALEALWAIHQTGGLDEELARKALRHANPDVRRWTVRLLVDRSTIPAAMAESLRELAKSEGNGEVRSQLASSARRLPASQGLPVVAELMQRSEDIDDPHIPLLLWWAVEAQALSQSDSVVALFVGQPGPLAERHLLKRLAQRYAADDSKTGYAALGRLFSQGGANVRAPLLSGVREAFKTSLPPSIPPELTELLRPRAGDDAATSKAIQLRLGQPEAVTAALAALTDARTPTAERIESMEILGQRKEPRLLPVLLRLAVEESAGALQGASLRTLQQFDDPAIAKALLDGLGQKKPTARRQVAEFLSKRRSWSLPLLRAVDRQALSRADVTHEALERIRLYRDTELDELIRKHWGATRSSPEDKRKRIADLSRQLSAGGGQPARGRSLFAEACGSCHKFFGEGATIGPDLTGYDRHNLEFLLVAIVDPSAGVREEYINFELQKKDGLLLTGFLLEQNPAAVTIADAQQGRVVVSRKEIASLQASPVSRMPEGLLDPFSEEQLRDFFAYLQSDPSKLAGASR